MRSDLQTIRAANKKFEKAIKGMRRIPGLLGRNVMFRLGVYAMSMEKKRLLEARRLDQLKWDKEDK